MHTHPVLLTAAFLLVNPVCIWGQADTPTPQVLTSGTGEVTLPPDRAILRIGIQTDDSSAALASAHNNGRFRSVVDTLAALGFPADSLQRLSYSVLPTYDRDDRGRITGYRTRTVIRLVVRDLQRLAALIDGALSAGATDIPFIQCESDSIDSAQATALAEALHQAQTDAATLAAASGTELGTLQEVSTVGLGSTSYAYAYQTFYEDVGPLDLAPREVRVAVTVHARWSLR